MTPRLDLSRELWNKFSKCLFNTQLGYLISISHLKYTKTDLSSTPPSIHTCFCNFPHLRKRHYHLSNSLSWKVQESSLIFLFPTHSNLSTLFSKYILNPIICHSPDTTIISSLGNSILSSIIYLMELM